MNIKTSANKSCKNNAFTLVETLISTSCSFVTKDGMSWTVDDNFTKSSKDAIITVDINGNKGPNSITTGNIDRFRFRVDAGGEINVYGQDNEASVQKALKALTSRKFRKED